MKATITLLAFCSTALALTNGSSNYNVSFVGSQAHIKGDLIFEAGDEASQIQPNNQTISVGIATGKGSLTLQEGSSFIAPNVLFIGGRGYNAPSSYPATSNEGVVTVNKNAVLHVGMGTTNTYGSQLAIANSDYGATGTLNVNGGSVHGGAWTTVGGGNSTGYLNISNGGRFTSSNANGSHIWTLPGSEAGARLSLAIGDGRGARGYVTVDGSGSLLEMLEADGVNGYAYVGARAGEGHLTVTRQGAASLAGTVVIGYNGTGVAEVTQGGSLTVNGSLNIGYHLYNSQNDPVGSSVASTGSLTVDGAGSSLTVEQATCIAANASGDNIPVRGELILSNGAEAMLSGSLIAGNNSGSSATIDLLSNSALTTNSGSYLYNSYMTIDRTAAWNANGDIYNAGTIDIYGSVLAASSSVITNDGTINLYSPLKADAQNQTIGGTGTTCIHIYRNAATTVADGSSTNPILSLGALPDEQQDVKALINLNDALSLMGKSYDFMSVSGYLSPISQDDVETINGTNVEFNYATGGSGFIKFNDNQYLGFNPHDWTQEKGTLTGCTFTNWVWDTMDDPDYVIQPDTGILTEDKTESEDLVVQLPDDSGKQQDITYSYSVVMDKDSHKPTTISLTSKEETNAVIQAQGLILIFDSEGEHQGVGEDAYIGFTENTHIQAEDEVNIKGSDNKAIAKSADIVLVQSENVVLSNLTMNVGQRLELEKIEKPDGSETSAELKLSGSQVCIGDTEIKDFTSFKIEDPSTSEEKIICSNDVENPIKLNSQDTIIHGGSKLELIATEANASFYGISMKDENGSYIQEEEKRGRIFIYDGAQVTLVSANGNKATLGSTDENAQLITIYDSFVKGTGTLSNVLMDGGRLTIGNSPGEMDINKISLNKSVVEFHFIEDPNQEWEKLDGLNNFENSADLFSYLTVNSSSSAKDVTIRFLYETPVIDSEGNPVINQETNKAEYTTIAKEDYDASDLQAGFKVQLINNVENLTFTNSRVDESTLPTLEAGLVWDTSTLFSEGFIQIINEITADPARIANTLVSAAGTTAHFGRMSLGHAHDSRALSGANVWASGFGTFMNHATSPGRTGFEYNAEGYAIGADAQVTESTIAGVAFGQSFGDHKPDHGNGYFTPGKIDQDGLLAGVYSSSVFRCAKAREDRLILDCYATYGQYDNESTRNSTATGREATADWDENTWALGVTLTRRMALDGGAFLSPFIGLEYAYADMDNVTEHGSTDVRYEGSSYQNLSIIAGLGLSKTFSLTETQKLTPYVSVAYVGDVMRHDGKVTAYGKTGTWAEKSSAYGREALQINVGAHWQISGHWGARAGYTAEIRERADDHNVNASVHYSF